MFAEHIQLVKGRIAMSDTALTKVSLEFTQKIQRHFPSNIDPKIVQAWNNLKKEDLEARLEGFFGKMLEPIVERLLEPIGEVIVPATAGRFVPKKRFVVKSNARVKISCLGDNFKEKYLDGGKIEDPIRETTLRYAKLREWSLDGPIIAELGGLERSEMMLSEMFSLMEKQGKGEFGVLLNNGGGNIFYIKDQDGTLRSVRVNWYNGGWDVDANSVEYPDTWYVGNQVFSRK